MFRLKENKRKINELVCTIIVMVEEVSNTADLLYFDFLSEPRIMLKSSFNIVNPAAIMFNNPYSYDEDIDGAQLTFSSRNKYKDFIETLAKDLIAILSDSERFGLEIPKNKQKPIEYSSNPSNVDLLVNEIAKKCNTNFCVIGLPSKVINKKYYEIKARFLGENMRTQLIKDDDLKSKYIQLSKKGKSKVLYNLATAIYTKLGGTPWILSEAIAEPEAILVGIGFSKIEKGYYVGTSYVKDIYGRDIDFKIIPRFELINIETEGLYLPQNELKRLMGYLISRHSPKAIYIYKTSRFTPKEIEVFGEYTDKIALTLVYINKSKPLRAFENKSTIRRGLLVGINKAETMGSFIKMSFFLWTTGNLTVSETGKIYDHKLGTPKGLQVEVYTNSNRVNINNGYSIVNFEKEIGKQVLALTKLNWNTIEWEIREPVITTYARKAAKIAAELEKLNLGSSRVYDIRDFI